MFPLQVNGLQGFSRQHSTLTRVGPPTPVEPPSPHVSGGGALLVGAGCDVLHHACWGLSAARACSSAGGATEGHSSPIRPSGATTPVCGGDGSRHATGALYRAVRGYNAARVRGGWGAGVRACFNRRPSRGGGAGPPTTEVSVVRCQRCSTGQTSLSVGFVYVPPHTPGRAVAVIGETAARSIDRFAPLHPPSMHSSTWRGCYR